ncbi:MAG TPA: restriction endonuclease [Hyphomicrobiaceae bacterium]|jgi:restriction system protein|nr:restriction endonuclease [Hyphomicrobiaceae bacterium]
MPIPDYQSLMLPLLKHATRGETRVPEVAEKVADELGLTQEEREQMLPSARQRLLHNRIHWAKSYMVKAGLLEQPRRGAFVASEQGRALLARNPEKIDVEMLSQYPEFREFYRRARGGDDAIVHPEESKPSIDEVTPEEQIEAAYSALRSALRQDLILRILQNSPSFFENVIIDLLLAMGYGGSHRSAAAQLGRSGDGGVDGIINEDRLGLDRVYIQAKRYAQENSIGRSDVQAFVGSLVGLGASKGVFVTTSSFSSQAQEFVRHLSQRVILIDGARLTELMIEHNVGVRVSRAIEFKRLDEDYFAEDE